MVGLEDGPVDEHGEAQGDEQGAAAAAAARLLAGVAAAAGHGGQEEDCRGELAAASLAGVAGQRESGGEEGRYLLRESCAIRPFGLSLVRVVMACLAGILGYLFSTTSN